MPVLRRPLAASVGTTMGISVAQWIRATGPPDLGQGSRGAAGWFACMCAGFYYDQPALGFIAGMLAWIVAFSDTSVGLSRDSGEGSSRFCSHRVSSVWRCWPTGGNSASWPSPR